MVTEFELSRLKQDPSSNRLLENGDTIHIPSFSPEVYVFGEVMSPGPISFQEKYSPLEYIKSSGSFSRVADTDRVILISPDGKSSVVQGKLFGRLNSNQVLPGSVIYVPREIGKVDGINLAASLSPIVSSFALSIASLNSINN